MFTKFAEASKSNLFASPFSKASCDAPKTGQVMPAIKEGMTLNFPHFTTFRFHRFVAGLVIVSYFFSFVFV